jgi:hypothetical protein
MDGTVADCILIPIVAMLSLAAGLIMVYWADSHPRWSKPPAAEEVLAVQVREERLPAEPSPRATLPS